MEVWHKKLPFPAVWIWQQSTIRRQFNLENLMTNSTLKQSKFIEISKDLVLILQIYHVYEKKGEKNLLSFWEKRVKNLPWLVQGQGIPFLPAGPRQGGLMGPPLPSVEPWQGGPAGQWQRGLGTPLPPVGLLPPAGPQQRCPTGLGPPLPPVGAQQFQATTARPLQQRACTSCWGPRLHRT
jgi:hypothetical protein